MFNGVVGITDGTHPVNGLHTALRRVTGGNHIHPQGVIGGAGFRGKKLFGPLSCIDMKGGTGCGKDVGDLCSPINNSLIIRVEQLLSGNSAP